LNSARITSALVTSLVLTLISCLPGSLWAQDAAASPRDTKLLGALSIYEQRADFNKHKAAHKAFAALAADFPRDYDLQVWCARTAYYFAHRNLQKGDSDTCSSIATEGVRCAKRAQGVRADGYDGRFWWVMNRVKAGTSAGVRAALKAVKPMREYLEGMIKAAPKRFEAYMCLGVLYRELPSFISWGDDDKALEYLQKAEALAPRNPELLLELAESYLKVGDDVTAIKVFEKVGRSEIPENMAWETDDARRWAKKRIREVKD
jgi:tetratricopeptide (TPR) repeat protein